MSRSVMIAAIVLLFASPAHALTCREIRQAIKSYGEGFVLTVAKSKGYSDRDIEAIKRVCRL